MTRAVSETDPSLALEVAGLSIQSRLDQAIEGGEVLRHEDGTLSLARVHSGDSYIGKYGTNRPPCLFLNYFLFNQVYAESTIPFGCRDCYKIKVSSRTLRAMMAVKEIAEASGHTTKSGTEVDNPINPDLYATYLYLQGLDQARKIFKDIRRSVDEHSDLGPQVRLTIKRGCTNYEIKCGPSDQYKFDPLLELAESYLLQRFVEKSTTNEQDPKKRYAKWLLKMIATAYRIGDDSYKDFTNGTPLLKPLVTYSPNDE